MAALVRDYTKWDDQPASVGAALESILRGYRIATTAPQGPVYVCLDAGLQEEAIALPPPLPPLDRYPPPRVVDPPTEAVAEIAAMLSLAQRPLILIGRVANDRDSFARRVELAERLGAPVISDLKTAASFPTAHPLHPFPAGIYISSEAGALVREADVIVSLDWVDLAGSLRQACGGQLPSAKVVQCSLDSYLHRGWGKDYQSLPPADILVLADPDRLVSALLACVPETQRASSVTTAAAVAPADSDNKASAASDARISIADMARVTSTALA